MTSMPKLTVIEKDESVRLAHTFQGIQQLIMVNFSYNYSLLTDCLQETAVLTTKTYTKKRHSLDGRTHNETDYICISKNWRSSMQDVRVFQGADCGGVHSLLSEKVRIKFKKIICKKTICKTSRYKEVKR